MSDIQRDTELHRFRPGRYDVVDGFEVNVEPKRLVAKRKVVDCFLF
jgi:hypothetical protein